MSNPNSNRAATGAERAAPQQNSPVLKRDREGQLDLNSVADVIQWFLDYDQRVAVIRHPKVEELFQWKQERSRSEGERVFAFNRAEDRLAIGIMQALAVHASAPALHDWIGQLLNALDEASKENEQLAAAYRLELDGAASTVKEAAKIPTSRGRIDFLTSCWLEVLCTAEIRVLGWFYQELYGHPYSPG
ncbi:MAG TPA: hypothetical protein VGX92_05300 [Pyrinomonadaceae bacterium]|jgi:hypothetical protein|nr:hypothetical protein [Pyrinomonadaceae bacterium]